MFFQHLSYLNMLVAAVAAALLGLVWYAPWALGGIWAKERARIEPSSHERRRPKALMWGSVAFYAIAPAFVLAALFHSLIVTSLSGMFVLALSVWAGFALPPKIADYGFGRDSLTLLAIEAGYALVAIALEAFIIGIWG